MIEEYLAEFDRFLIGRSDERAEWRAELASHLRQAEEAGDLDAVMARLGTPREAAAAFRTSRPLTAATPKARLRAALIDYAAVAAVTVAVIVEAIVNNRNLAISIPPPLGGSSTYPMFRNIAVPAVLLCTWFGLAWIEAKHGRTPGKALTGLRTVSDDQTPVSWRQTLLRQAVITVGPFLWIDVLFMLFALGQQRLLDRWAHTLVVEDPEPHAPPVPTVRPLPSS